MKRAAKDISGEKADVNRTDMNLQSQAEQKRDANDPPQQEQQPSDDTRGDEQLGHQEGLSSSSATAAAAAQPARGGTYPKPTTFGERLMHVLENGIAPEAIWWQGEEGDALALHPPNLKESSVLNSHFQGNRYSSFIRNLNRWGFRRVSHHPVPSPVVVYFNSLFQRNQPDLVKLMKMDSDVQDVYERTQLDNKRQKVGEEEEKVSASEEKQASLDDVHAPPDEPSANANLVQHQQLQHAVIANIAQQQQRSREQPREQPMEGERQNQLLALLQQAMSPPQEASPAPVPSHDQAQSQNQESMTQAVPAQIVEMLLRRQQSGGPSSQATTPVPAHPSLPTESQGSQVRCGQIMTQMIGLAEQYLEQPQPSQLPDPNLTTIVRLLVHFGTQQLQATQQPLRRQQPIRHVAANEPAPNPQFLTQLVSSNQQSLPRSSPPSSANVSANRSLGEQVRMLLQQQNPSTAQNQASVPSNVYDALTVALAQRSQGQSSQQYPRQQTLPPPPPQQPSQGGSQANASMIESLQQLLLGQQSQVQQQPQRQVQQIQQPQQAPQVQRQQQGSDASNSDALAQLMQLLGRQPPPGS